MLTSVLGRAVASAVVLSSSLLLVGCAELTRSEPIRITKESPLPPPPAALVPAPAVAPAGAAAGRPTPPKTGG